MLTSTCRPCRPRLGLRPPRRPRSTVTYTHTSHHSHVTRVRCERMCVCYGSTGAADASVCVLKPYGSTGRGRTREQGTRAGTLCVTGLRGRVRRAPRPLHSNPHTIATASPPSETARRTPPQHAEFRLVHRKAEHPLLCGPKEAHVLVAEPHFVAPAANVFERFGELGGANVERRVQ
eukprot:2704158-Prymnesium_polylepis.1